MEKKKKLKLNFQQLEKEFTTIMSSEELQSILGGAYGDANSWSTQDGFLTNVNTMLSGGLLNYVGTGSFTGNFNSSQFVNGGSSISLFGSLAPGNSVWNFGTTGTIGFGSAHYGSSSSPAPLVGTFGNWSTQFTAANLNPNLVFINPNGQKYTIGYNSSTHVVTVKLTVPF